MVKHQNQKPKIPPRRAASGGPQPERLTADEHGLTRIKRFRDYNYAFMHKHRNFLLAIVFVWAVIYLASIFTPPLLDDADTVHAEAAREMLTRNDWVTLHIDLGIRYLEKAPLMYWA